MTFPAPVVALSTIANPTIVLVPAVQAANVSVEEFEIVDGVAPTVAPQSPDVARRA